MDDATLEGIRDTSASLVKERDELARYNREGYLNGSECEPGITVSISNHPTYLKDFEVRLLDDDLRKIVVKAALRQRNRRIDELEITLETLIA